MKTFKKIQFAPNKMSHEEMKSIKAGRNVLESYACKSDGGGRCSTSSNSGCSPDGSTLISGGSCAATSYVWDQWMGGYVFSCSCQG